MTEGCVRWREVETEEGTFPIVSLEKVRAIVILGGGRTALI